VVCWWRTGGPNPCVVDVILVVAYRGTWDFTTWCSPKGGRCGVDSCPAPTGLAVVGMSRSLRCVCFVVRMLCCPRIYVGA